MKEKDRDRGWEGEMEKESLLEDRAANSCCCCCRRREGVSNEVRVRDRKKSISWTTIHNKLRS